jgi:hypothetical protein
VSLLLRWLASLRTPDGYLPRKKNLKKDSGTSRCLKALVPDVLICAAIRRMLGDRLRQEDGGSDAANRAKLLAFC